MEPLRLRNGRVLPHRIFAGPMEGIMSPVFCKTVDDLDLLDFWVLPFIRISNSVPGLKVLERRLLHYRRSGKPVIVQFLGNDPELIAATVKRLEELDVSCVNLNFACPSNKVQVKNGGGKLLLDPQKIRDIIAAIADRCRNVSISVKLRAGYESPRELESFIPVIACEVVDFIILHFRTVRELYGKVETPHERLARAVSLTQGVPLIGSGDVFTVKDALTMHEKSGCHGVTVARGLLENPFLIRNIWSTLNGKRSSEDKDAAKRLFFETMQKNLQQRPDVYWQRSSFLELAKFIWGERHPNFLNLLRLSDREIQYYQPLI